MLVRRITERRCCTSPSSSAPRSFRPLGSGPLYRSPVRSDVLGRSVMASPSRSAARSVGVPGTAMLVQPIASAAMSAATVAGAGLVIIRASRLERPITPRTSQRARHAVAATNAPARLARMGGTAGRTNHSHRARGVLAAAARAVVAPLAGRTAAVHSTCTAGGHRALAARRRADHAGVGEVGWSGQIARRRREIGNGSGSHVDYGEIVLPGGGAVRPIAIWPTAER